MMTITLAICIALALDAWLGEPRRFHPLVGFGHLTRIIEQHLYLDSTVRGLLALLLLLIPFTLLVTWIHRLPGHFIIDVLILYLAIGWHSLSIHAKRVQNALLADDLNAARHQVSLILSRDTTTLDHTAITQGTIESVLENGNDAIFGVLFWFAVAGAPGALIYRLVNTLDAMWGYRNTRYRHFGWAAARFDDLLNLIPARLTALSYALTGEIRSAFICWQAQGATWKSPNAGPVMAAGAGSLEISLGGPAYYHGALEFRPMLGTGRIPEPGDIDRALGLIKRSLLLWLFVLCIGEWLVKFIITA
ncbi:adenosylcobinamide-phosphate synthase CbiB [Nitrosomonas cryotolerans]